MSELVVLLSADLDIQNGPVIPRRFLDAFDKPSHSNFRK